MGTMTPFLLIACFGDPSNIDGVTPTAPSTTEPSTEPDEPTEDAEPTAARVYPSLGGGAEQYRFAVIGDFGNGSKESLAVGALVGRMKPDFIVTVGDNNYPDGEAETMDDNVGQLYQAWIGNYKGKYGKGSEENRFWPCPGNHDWYSDDGLDPYTDYFTLPGNERYYEFRHEDIHFFCVDSDTHEPDGVTPDSIQGQWLKEAMASSDAAYQIVYMHHPPYASGSHGDNKWMQWPFMAWGADLLFGGHDHIYERQVHDGVPFLVTGIGGYRTYAVRDPSANSQLAFNDTHGATLVRVFPNSLLVETWSINDGLIDRFRMRPEQPMSSTRRLVHLGDDWRFTTDTPAEDWSDSDFDDATWTEGMPAGEQVWARRRFQAPDGISRLTLEIVADGSTEVFLNTTPLTTPITGSTTLLDLSASALLEGENVLSVYSTGGSKSSGIQVRLRGLGGEELIAPGSQWLTTSIKPIRSWINTGFEDTAWTTQDAPISAPFTAPDTASPGSPVRMWMRHHFTVTDPESVEAMLLSISRSDGAVAYLNGREIHRAGLPDGTLADDAMAIAAVESEWVHAPLTTLVEPGLLVAGENVLSVAVYGASARSTGLWMDLSLTAL